MQNKEKRVPKSEINYKVDLTEEQKIAKRLIKDNKVTVLYGPAGVSKTFTSVAAALDLFFTRQVNKIVICRPAVPLEDIGFLPGLASEKLMPYLTPILDNLYQLCDKVKIDSLLKEGKIEILPLAFVQGMTINDILIVDEFQNSTEFQIEEICTRIGKEGRIVFSGDIRQTAVKRSSSGFERLLRLNGRIDNFAVMEMKTNFRDPFVQDFLKLY